MMKWAQLIGTIGISGLLSPAYAGDEGARQSYLNQACHNSTAAIYKRALKRESKDVNVFCDCVSKTAVSRLEQSQDHTYALAYHEANIVVERSKRYNRPATEIVLNLSRRSSDYETDYGVSQADLKSHLLTAVKDTQLCYDETPSAASLGLRGPFSGAFN